MRIAVSGSSGLVGSELVPLLESQGHQVQRLVRNGAEGGIGWDPGAGRIESGKLAGTDAVVHLAGEGIAARRWNAAHKARIRDSRVLGTGLLCQALAGLDEKPGVLISASAIGYYGDRGDEIVDETAPAGEGFLAEVCQAWEAATAPAADAGIRVVHLRTGLVLSAKGGALPSMLWPFKLGIAGPIGGGRQYSSWIALDDVLRAIGHLLETDALQGPVNLVAPNPVTNYDFTKTMGRVLRRPTVLPMPSFAARMVFGEMANELILASARVSPEKLTASGFKFEYPELEPALRHVCSS